MKIVITRKIPETGIDLLKKKGILPTCPIIKMNRHNRAWTRQELLKNVRGSHAILCLLNDKIDKELFEVAGSQLKIVANYAVGYDNIDLTAARNHRVWVTNTPDVLTSATAELVWSLIFSVARRIPESDYYTRAGKFQGWAPQLFLGIHLSGKTLGIIGAGRIGQCVAEMAQGFGLKILYYNRTRKHSFEKNSLAKKVSLNTLLKKSDIVSLHLPLTSETHHLIGKKEFDLLKSDAIFINTARGPIVEEPALIDLLQKKKIWGAGLDVYEKEPEIPEKLKKLSNTVLTPHSGSGTIEARDKMSLLVAENILVALKNKKPKNALFEF